MNSVTKLFLSKLKESKKDSRHSYYRSSWDEDVAINALMSFNKRDTKKIISDNYWNRYPTWSTSTSKIYGPAIGSIVLTASRLYPSLMRFIIDNGDGLWLCYAIDHSFGDDNLRASRRGLKSKDVRARKRGAQNVPVSTLKRYLSENSDKSIRNIAINRIGLSNCYKQLVDDENEWIKGMAIKASPLDDLDYKNILNNCIEKINKDSQWGSWRDRAIAESILLKMDKDELLYVLDLVKDIDQLSKVVSSRLSSSEWG